MKLTNKQLKIMQVIVAGDGRDPKGSLIPVDLDELLERVGYPTTKQSMQFSIRALIAHNLIYKAGQDVRRGRKRVLLAPSERGRTTMAFSVPQSILEPEDPVPGISLQDLLA